MLVFMIQTISEIFFPRTKSSVAISAYTPEAFYIKAPKISLICEDSEKDAEGGDRKGAGKLIDTCFAYRDPLVKSLIKEIKDEKNERAINIAGYALALKICRATEARDLILIPIPTTYLKYCKRGYNPTELISKSAEKYLVRNGFTAKVEKRFLKKKIFSSMYELFNGSQKSKNRIDRLKNPNLFYLDKKSNVPKNSLIVVIDDVITTGATIGFALEIFERAGFDSIFGLSVVH